MNGNAVRYFEERRKEAAVETLKALDVARRHMGEAVRAIDEGGNSHPVASHLIAAEMNLGIAIRANQKGTDLRVER